MPSFHQVQAPQEVHVHASRSVGDRLLLLSWAALAALCINYLVQVSRFHSIQRVACKEEPKCTPKYPSLIPWIGHVLPFALDNMRFVDCVVLGTLDPKTLTQSPPVLSSVFAETLRLHSTMYSTLTARGADANLGRWRLPQGEIGVVSTGLSHMDETVWNTQDGQHPLARFWADRFLVYPDDPISGPLNTNRRRQHIAAAATQPKNKSEEKYSTAGAADPDGPTFSLEGLEGSWIPYGAGRHACPGRVMSKQMVLYVVALIVSRYDIELLDGPVPVEKDKWSFGFNVAVPRDKIPFQIRKRE